MAVKKDFRIDVYSHNVKVSKFNDKGRACVNDFIRPLIQFGTERVRGHWGSPPRYIKKALRVYATALKNRSEFRFHIHQYQQLLNHLKDRGYQDENLKIVVHKLSTVEKVIFGMDKSWQSRDYQIPIEEYLCNDQAVNMLPLQTGKGKELALDAKIKVPDGWKTMGEMQLGDEVISRDGTTTKVNGVYPQGKKALYWVTFSDGRRVEAGLDHLWSVYKSESEDTSTVMDTKTIQLLLEQKTSSLFIDLCESEKNKDKPLDVDPWLLGSRLRAAGPDDESLLSLDLKPVLEALGLFKVNEIPKEYLEGSTDQRFDLLRGLIGNAERSEFRTDSLDLAKQVQYLVRSLGGTASLDKHKRHICPYTVDIGIHIYSYHDKIGIESVVYSRDTEAQCISVEHPERLYITDDFIVTHNTFCALKATDRLGVRTALVIKGMYVEKWISDVEEAFTGFTKKDIMVVRGSSSMKALIDLAQEGLLKAKFIIITNKTMYNYFKEYEQYGKRIKGMGYNCMPEDLYQTLGVGLRIVDETHQEFHTNFRLDLYTHTIKTIALSATLESTDAFMNRMYEIAFPKPLRYAGEAWDRYISVRALTYRFENPKLVKHKGKRGSYSHVAFEQSIMARKTILKNYLNMILRVVKNSYLNVREGDQRMLIFCATVDMCDTVTQFLNDVLPEVDTRRYTSDDDYEELMKAEIAVSTLKSSGTAVDIESLRICLMTDSVDSIQANLQAAGRLRRLKKYPDVTPEFLYLVSLDVEAHNRYHQNKYDHFKGRVLSHMELNTGLKI